MLVALSATITGWVTAWYFVKTIVRRWPRWWVALLAVTGAIALSCALALLIMALAMSIMGEPSAARSSAAVRVFGYVFWTGVLAAIMSGIRALRPHRKVLPPAYGHAEDASRSRYD